MRAALYARVSSEEQVEGYSIDAQRRAFQALVEGRGWSIYQEYYEDGKTAWTDNINRRPAFKQMAADALAGKFDVLVVHKLDRFSRNLRITLEYFDKLSKAGVAFLSINEQMDFSTPWGKLALTLLGGMAQFYSDNLSQETKKGWHERRAQGLYCGLLPFGAMKGEDGVPVPDMREVDNRADVIRNYEGLLLAFQETIDKGDREIAILLNSRGYRTTGNRGANLFSRDTVRDMLQNRFYIGELPDGNGGWIKGKHQPLIPVELFEAAQRARAQRSTRPNTMRADAKACSLSGVARCADCGGTMRALRAHGRVRLVCTNRIKNKTCSQPSGYLDLYEQQLIEYLSCFHIPEDYQHRILEAHRKLQLAYDDVSKQKAALERHLQRAKELYEWGHKSKEEYWAGYNMIQAQLQSLAPAKDQARGLERLALFLKDISEAWKQADQQQRNRLAKQLFDIVWIKNKKVLAVTPRPSFKPFFDLQYDGLSKGVLHIRPRGGSGY
jgi:DNA invertase Pin-like site-specific DNA recombinase